jgi:hypothetical protein
MCWPAGQHLLLTVDKIGSVKRCQFETVAMSDRVRWASLNAVSAKDAAVVVDVVNLGVPLGAADAVLRGIFCGLNVYAIGRTSGGAEEAGNAFLQPVLVALQNVGAAKPRFDAGSAQRIFAVGIIFDRRRLEHLHEGDAHTLGDGRDVFQNWHACLVYRKKVEIVRGAPSLA